MWFVHPAAAQLANNATIQGAYNFRYLGVNATSSDAALSYQGVVTFDGKADANGNGTFTVSGQGANASAGPPANNIYAVLSNGLMYMTNPFDTSGQTFLTGGVGNGALMLSSTDTFYCDLLLAAPVATSASTASLSGKYYLASMDFLNGNFTQTRNTFFNATASNGSFGNFTITGTAVNLGSTPQSQSSSATFNVNANGTGTLTFSGTQSTSTLLAGAKSLIVAPDGSFFIAGGTSSYDLIVGVKALTGSATGILKGNYFQGFLEEVTDSSQNFSVYAGAGSATEVSTVEYGHQRVQPDYSNAYDDTYAADFTLGSDGTVTYSNSAYAVGANGNIVIGTGGGMNYQVIFYVKTLTQTGSGVFLDPQQIISAASYAPFTASISPGEFVLLKGTGLASQFTQAQTLPLPNTLNNVSVSISWFDANGNLQTTQAPLYYVSPTAISLIVPYTAPSDGTFLTFQVNNNGTKSNTGTVYSGPSSPGIFTSDASGTGNGAIQKTNGSTTVNSGNPATAGDTIVIYLTGLGPVSPPATAGAPAPSNPASQVVIPDVFIGGVQATVVPFAGLTPTAAGLYQINLTVPAGVPSGNQDIEIDTYDSANNLLAVSDHATIAIK